MRISGTHYSNSEVFFKIWSPEKKQVLLHILAPDPQVIRMTKDDHGYFVAHLTEVYTALKYFFETDEGEQLPDPASHYQPEGVHGPSQLVDHSKFEWKDPLWRNIPKADLIFYEIHVGTFTPEGTFEAIIPRLNQLAELGINALEIMPVSQFPGGRNWGYDGVFPTAVQDTYGGPEGFKNLINAAHEKGIAVFLDVVFNHIGPEGNCFAKFGPYFTDRYQTPWGNAINFDDAWSDGVREYFSDVIIHWYEHYHLDGLRLDAIHTIFDNGAVTFWELVEHKLNVAQQKNGKAFYLIAESDLNSPRVVQSAAGGGYGFQAQWLDDFHHALYVLLDPKGKSRYEDFGQIQQLAKAYTDGFVHSGEYVKFRNRKHGASSAGLPGDTFVVFNQNHDQIGNRVGGERLSMLVDFERLKIAAAAIFLSPYLPMLFMGEEYADDSPFFYFVSHTDADLIKMVVEGRKKEFASFGWDKTPPEPHETATFEESKIHWEKRSHGRYKTMLDWHKALITIRKGYTAFKNFEKNDVRVNLAGNGFTLLRKSDDQSQQVVCCFNLAETDSSMQFPESSNDWQKILDSQESKWLENNASPNAAFPTLVNSGGSTTAPGLSVAVFVSNN
jgi:maltooligosyltrehalose trehalohydrolase